MCSTTDPWLQCFVSRSTTNTVQCLQTVEGNTVRFYQPVSGISGMCIFMVAGTQWPKRVLKHTAHCAVHTAHIRDAMHTLSGTQRKYIEMGNFCACIITTSPKPVLPIHTVHTGHVSAPFSVSIYCACRADVAPRAAPRGQHPLRGQRRPPLYLLGNGGCSCPHPLPGVGHSKRKKKIRYGRSDIRSLCCTSTIQQMGLMRGGPNSFMIRALAQTPQ